MSPRMSARARRFRLLLRCTGPVIVTLLTTGVAPASAQTPEDVLSHFRCYTVEGNVPELASFQLIDQFEDMVAQVGVPSFDTPTWFCNPADKTVGGQLSPRRNPDAHLACFTIEPKTPFDPRTVEVSNQFGVATLEVISRQRLCVPSRKIIEGEPPPPTVSEIEAQLDHFKCYRVQVGSAEPRVIDSVEDQFGRDEGVVVGFPDALCNPVTKVRDAETTPSANPSAHLVCYRTSGPSTVAPGFFGFAENQLAPAGGSAGDPFSFFANPPDRLCVPSLKRELGGEPPPPPVPAKCAKAQEQAEAKCERKGSSSKQCEKAQAKSERKCA